MLSEINTGLTNLRAHSLAINPNDHIFVGTLGGGFFRSIDGGDSWNEINSGLINKWIKTFTIATNGDFLAWTGISGLFRSTDNGESWMQVIDNLKGNDVHCLSTNSSGDIFAGTWQDGGRSLQGPFCEPGAIPRLGTRALNRNRRQRPTCWHQWKVASPRATTSVV